MVTDARTRSHPCPTCRAGAGARCVIRGLTSDAFHAARLDLARHEERGPIAGEPVYYRDRKWRVVDVVAGEKRVTVRIRLSQGPREIEEIAAGRISYDTTAGLWRVAE